MRRCDPYLSVLDNDFLGARHLHVGDAVSFGVSLLVSGHGGVCRADRAQLAPQHFLYFFPLPHGHGSFRPTRGADRLAGEPGITVAMLEIR